MLGYFGKGKKVADIYHDSSKKRWKGLLFLYRCFIICLLILQLLLIIYTLAGSRTISAVARAMQSVLSLGVCIYIIAKKDKGAFKLTWVFLIMLFPVVGGPFYIIFNFQLDTRRFSQKTAKTEAKARQFLLQQNNAYKKAAILAPQHFNQIRYLQDFAGFAVYEDCQTKYFNLGETFLEKFLIELEKAEKYIFLEYFIVQEGLMWDKILTILKKKINEGVKVRLMYDDIGSFLLLPKDFPSKMVKLGIECYKFNPFRPFLTAKQNNRDHRKIAVIDGKVAFTGGINLADEYINAIEKHGHWKDSAVMIKGKAAWSFTLMFLQMWELCSGKNEDYKQFSPWVLDSIQEERQQNEFSTESSVTGFVQPYADSPMDRENVGEHVYLQIINGAKDYVYITTPYLIVDDSVLSALCLAAKSGVDVRIITPYKWDKRLVHMTTRSYYRELVNSGVKVYEYTKGFIHSKTFVSDDVVATVGTTNLDFRSLYLHFECGLWMYKTSAVMEVKSDFLDTLNVCTPITKEDCKYNLVTRSIQDALRIFAPLM